MSQRISKGGVFVASVVAVCALLIAIIILADRRHGLTYTVSFKEAKELPVGAPVSMRGARVGEVTAVRLNDDSSGVLVDVSIDPEHRRRIHALPNTTARIKSDSLVLGRPFLDVLNRGEPGAGLQNGAMVEGLDGWMDEKLWVTGGAVTDGAKAVAAFGKEQADQLERWATEGKGSELREDAADLLNKLELAASDSGGKAKEKLGDALDKGAEFLKRLREEEGAEVAEKFESSLSALAEKGKDVGADSNDKFKAAWEKLKDFKKEKLDPAFQKAKDQFSSDEPAEEPATAGP